ncbi:MAG: hypothetical protein AB9856_01730 [Cellulosilyticaceae bacterium]
MTGIHLYCKANKRKRNNKAVGIYAYIIQEGEASKESINLLEEETRVARLELLALATGLQDLEAHNKLEGDVPLAIYVTNEYILEELQKGMEDQASGKALNFSKGTEYTELWKIVESLLGKGIHYTATSLNKKDRGENDEEIKRNMGMLNKMACDEINRYFSDKE